MFDKNIWDALQRKAYKPFLLNHADGVDGHYAIARHSPKGNYYEFWNHGKWSSEAEVFKLSEKD